VAFNPFEAMVRAIVGQQITVKAATTIAGRIVKTASIKTDGGFPDGLAYFFPNAEELINMNLEGLGMTHIRQRTVRTVTRTVLDKTLSLSSNQSFESFHAAFVSLKGIGDWTANYVGMRGLGMIDAFPAGDLGIIKAMTRGGEKPTVRDILARSERWRPYRAYATLCLWNSIREE